MLIKLTTTDDSPILVNTDHVASVELDYDSTVKVIMSNGYTHNVKQSMDEVQKKCVGYGAFMVGSTTPVLDDDGEPEVHYYKTNKEG